MQIYRLFEIIYLLMEKECVTARELAERFEVSTRTIYRDVDLLSGSGIPVYASKGKGGGIRLLPEFVLNKSVLSEAEQGEILFALQTMKATSADAGGRVLSRLSALFQKDSGDWIDVDFSHWGSGTEARQVFQTLKTAILERRVVSFTYYSSYGLTTTRCVEPVKLTFKHGSWYLQAFCLTKQGYRTFKVMRMEEVTLTDQRFEIRSEAIPLLDLPYSEWKSSEKLEESAPRENAPVGTPLFLTLRFRPEMAFRVYDEFDRVQITREADGFFTVEACYPEDSWVYSCLLSFGEGVEVIQPERVRTALRRKAEQICKIYDGQN